jgi:hypothetical protein
MEKMGDEMFASEAAINDLLERVRALLTRPGVYSFQIATDEGNDRREHLSGQPQQGATFGEPLDRKTRGPWHSITIRANGAEAGHQVNESM